MPSTEAVKPVQTFSTDSTDTGAVPEWFKTDPLSLAENVELLVGANENPMLFEPESGTYFRLTPMSAKIVGLFSGEKTGDEIARRLARAYPDQADSIYQSIYEFVDDLRQADVLNVSADEKSFWKRTWEKIRKRPMLRLKLTGPVQGILEPMAGAFKKAPRALLTSMAALLTVSAVLLVVHAFRVGPPLEFDPEAAAPLWVLFLLVMGHMIVHEGSHALVTQYFGVPIRESGIGLLYYFIPVAYVDRTDTYRLKNKWKRAAIALAGPMADLIMAGVSAVLIISLDGPWQRVFQGMMLFQLVLFVNNLNPLLPTDGYHAAEAALGEINFRARASTFLLRKLTGKPLPAHLRNITGYRSAVYIIYPILTAAFIGLLFTVFAWSIVTNIRG